MMTDGHRYNSVGERKLIWDEENRLLSVDDNGFVSNYWYDADGERTVKTSGKSDQVYVNGVFSGGSTNTAKFSLYVSLYLVANLGGRYTKHIYAGSQRIVSKVGDFASYGSDPRRIEYAGSETDGLSVDYKSKYTAQQQVIKDHYQFFDVPYNGTDNNNYADGEGFCCNDGTLEAAQAKAMKKSQSRVASRSFKAPDNYENLQFFYHPDHLGSSGFITNLDGEVIQHIEYVPFGEVFIEERNSVWNTPYLFNAKEFDEETGLYYYGARYYEPRLSLWMSTDIEKEKYPDVTPYCYVANNPVKRKEINGEDWVEENGVYTYNPLVSNVADAAKFCSNETKYLFPSGKLYAKDGSYSYDLEVGGHVRDSYTKEIMVGRTTTKAGSVIINNNQYISSKELSFVERWSNSDDFLAQVTYSMVNDVYICVRAFSCGALSKPEWENPITGACFGNLDGTPNYKQIDAVAGVASWTMGSLKGLSGVKLAAGFKPFNKLNAAQFSKMFKGTTINRMKPSTRGAINRQINSGIEQTNKYVGEGKAVLPVSKGVGSVISNDESK